MLRLAPTRISIGEDDVRHHLARVYLRRTESAAGDSADRSDGDEDGDEDEDEDEDEDDGTSVGSQAFSTYALSHSKASGSDFSEPGSWSSQDRWQTNWRTHALCSSLAESVSCVNLGVSVQADNRAHALVSVPDVKRALVRSSSRQSQSRHFCQTGSHPHSPGIDTPTLTTIKPEPRVIAERPLNTAGERTKKGSKPPKPQIPQHLSLAFLQQLERSANLSLTVPFATLNLILKHAASQRLEHQEVEPNAALKQSQLCHILHFHQNTKTSALLNPLARLLSQICQNKQLVEIIMDGARSPSNSAPWRRGVRTRNHSTWRRILQGESRSNGSVVNGQEIRSAPPGEDSGHQTEQTATGESPSCGAVERARDEDISVERARVRNAMSISALAPAANNIEIQPLHRASASVADANHFSGGLPTMRELDPAAYPTGSVRVFHDQEAQRRDSIAARSLQYHTRMDAPSELASPAALAYGDRACALTPEYHNSTVMYSEANATPQAPSAAGEYDNASAWPGEHHAGVPFVRPGGPEVVPKDAVPDESPAVGVSRSPVVHVQPFTPVNPPSRTGQESSATPHGGHSEPNNDNEPEAEFKAKLRFIERRLKRMIADELREPDIINIYDYGLGTLRRKPLGEWYREPVNRDE